jgi:NTP pyrophosphatase (non-canonical NTP hydrolase)
MMSFSLRQFQQEQKEWSDKNFVGKKDYQPLLGAVEELGELAHAHLKGEQGIRGTDVELRSMAQDAVADVIIYLADYCNMRGFDLEQILEQTWGQVKQRNWKKNKLNGEVKNGD